MRVALLRVNDLLLLLLLLIVKAVLGLYLDGVGRHSATEATILDYHAIGCGSDL